MNMLHFPSKVSDNKIIKYKRYQTCPTPISGCNEVIEEPLRYFQTEDQAKLWAFDYLSKFIGELVYLRAIQIYKHQRFDSLEIKWQVKIRITVKQD